jgi:hypothetical protein
MSPELLIALTFDAEMDAFDTSIASADSLEWRGIEEGVPQIESILADVRDSRGSTASATWFVRCDDQIGHMTGSPAYLLERYQALWQKRWQMGDEIAFHPHLYRQQDGLWKQDMEPESLRSQIQRSLAAMQGAGFLSRVSRIGEAFGSNALIAALDECGMQCDSTAMPGRVRVDAERSLDWGVTPAGAYHPSVADYRVPGKPARRLLEVPMSMIQTRADYDRAPLMRYLDLSFHPRVLRDGLAALVGTAQALVTVTHPSTILPGHAEHGLLSFSVEAFAKNLCLLLQECLHQGRSFRFITLRERADFPHS